ncbi:hypothetical protein AAFP35_24020 [Gordonia sp. CPCC 206044]|uniref:hypothetical protein n=1 Tax=Gordonia sp. CPCC 206044 TaxID=3140793 RepID=UPI003AF3E4C6
MSIGPDDELRGWSFLDDAASVDLGDVGSAGYTLAEAIRSDGERRLWIVDELVVGSPDADHGARQPPPHEELGPLPADWRDAIDDAPLRCGAPCADGRGPCRIVVSAPGHRCHWHRTSTRQQHRRTP